MRHASAIAAAALASLVACHSSAATKRTPDASRSSVSAPAERPKIGIVTREGGRHAVSVELATTEDERRVGLMNRKQLGTDDGMLFVFDREQPLNFWMHNTLISLDMVFIHTDGTITGIVENATPLTDTPRGVPGMSRYVLEVNGGWCGSHGVKAGDRVELGPALEAARARTGAP